MRRTIQVAGLAALAVLIDGGAALAQSASSTASQYSHGYGPSAGDLISPVNVNTRDANGNRTIVDGVIQTGNDNSIFGKLNVNGALDQFAGAGSASGASASGAASGTASAIGNNLTVVTNGNFNTVIVNANQTNTGTVTATTTVLNGKIKLDGEP
jgi:holdfast attachment protein HfaA